MMLEMINGYAGSNPQADDRVERTDDRSFVVRPESEDGDSNYKFAFDVTARNKSDRPQALSLVVDWQEPPEVGTTYMDDRRSIFVIGESVFDEVSGRLDGDRARFELDIPPGEVRICLHPPFGTDELDAFFTGISALPGARRITYGRTAEGRALEAGWLPAEERADRCVLAIGRIHPYETAGSYFIAGIADLLATGEASPLRRDTSFLLVPMVNPDGVAHGLCKRTTTGAELGAEGISSSDPAASALNGLVCGVAAASAQAVLIDAHGWMIEEDGPIFYSSAVREGTLGRLDRRLFPNGLRVSDYSDRPADPETTDLRRCAVEQLGMSVLVTSHPWFGRRPDDMRKVGANLTAAFLGALG